MGDVQEYRRHCCGISIGGVLPYRCICITKGPLIIVAHQSSRVSVWLLSIRLELVLIESRARSPGRPTEKAIATAMVVPLLTTTSRTNLTLYIFCTTMLLLVLTLVLSFFPSRVVSNCYEPTPAFPPPSWTAASGIRPAFDRIEARLHDLKKKYNTSSYSIEITSSSETLWNSHHTATILNETRPGDRNVSGRSQYRIASITKTFTTLALLQLASDNRVSLDDPILKYIPELNSSAHDLPWKDTSLRILASQLSGLPREFAQGDLLNLLKDPLSMGLPPVSDYHGLPSCDEYVC